MSQDFPHCARAVKLQIFSVWMKWGYSFVTPLGLPSSKKEDCVGSKRSKDRLTVAFCAS